MSTSRLIEADVDMITAEIKASIPAALAAIRTDRADAAVSTEAPQSYFIYPTAKGYRLPAVFVIADGMDFRKSEGSNTIAALARINVAILVEDISREKLTRKAYRYQSALHQVLDLKILTSTDNKVRLVCKVMRSEFSDIYSKTDDEKSPNAVFRKEIYIGLEVEHYENY